MKRSFFRLFLEVTCICQELEITIAMPRKSNVVYIPHDIQAENHTEFYYRVFLIILFVDKRIQSLESRFTKHKVILKGFRGTLPSFVVKEAIGIVKELIQFYASDLTSSESAMKTELQ
ncbi:hypothetical protein QYM36_015036 [Artemia franciscana]|uniref:Uncharacterized protein n=1 Tax=Artemia franciscana TaxID=6661 RepID=A0AA88HHN1_ARTSF|nr:hypothetical protein QYM36_015036 [Artemia franciscana]